MTTISDSVVRFHKRYAVLSILVFMIFVMVFIVLMVNHYRLKTVHETKLLEHDFADTLSHLDTVLAAVTMRVDGLRISAEADLNESGRHDPLVASQAFSSLTEDTRTQCFHLDVPQPPLQRETIGNLTGEGSLQGRSRDFYREINMALRLNPHFHAIAASLKNTAWVYYISAKGFLNIYPWVDSTRFKFSKELYSHGFYSLGLPENNPGRRRFWTEVYVDEYGKGLMTTCAAPVYDKDRFAGTVAIDLTVDFLNTTIKAFRAEQGVMFIVNERNQLVAHPTLITSSDKRTRGLAEALPLTAPAQARMLDALKDFNAARVQDHIVLKATLTNAPWRVFYMERPKSEWQALVAHLGIDLLVILLTIPIFIIFLLVVTNRYFIRPSQQFARFIMARSQRASAVSGDDVPLPWRPWFAAVEKTFNENEALTTEIQRQKDELENRVQQRTAELAASNRQLGKQIVERMQIEASLRENEAKYRRIFENIVDTYFETDIAGRILEISPSIEKILPFERAQLIGRSTKDFVQDPFQVDQILDQIQQHGRVSDIEVVLRDKQGAPAPFSLNAVVERDDQGKAVKIIGSIRDIGDRKRVEAEKKELETRLQRAEKMEALGTLAGGVAHDLNNILSGIISYPELLLFDLDADSPLRKPIETIKQSGEKAAAIVQDMLTLARRGIAAREVIDLNRLIEAYLNSPEFFQLQSLYTDIRFEAQLETNLLSLYGSPVHLSKTIMNLILNAAEAITGRGRVVVATANQYVDRPIKGYDKVEEGDYVVVTVADDGQGIPAEDVDKIFEPFYTKKKMGRSGTGLGMAVVWGTVKDHGGYIDVHSVVDQGTTVKLYFRAARTEVAVKPEMETPSSFFGSETVLVVDDVKEQRELAQLMLSRLGYAVTTASSGEAAVAFLQHNRVDLVVLDMIMDPGMDGLDTYIQILALHPGQKAIITSGYSENERVREAQRLGAGAYVRKPYLLHTIGQAVRAALDKT